uniref:Uncharacterized protein n=1 Tax=Arundo donax TaxID=35708 RepID=A0A0A9BVE8_ARUDO
MKQLGTHTARQKRLSLSLLFMLCSVLFVFSFFFCVCPFLFPL